jgi:DNA-binding CsgD family transcriptional regulator
MLAPERHRTEMERTLALSREIHSRNWISSAAAGLAWALTRLGELEAAEALLEESLFDSTPMRTQSRRLLWAARANLALRQDEPQLALAIADRLYATALNLTAERDIPQLALLKAAALAALARLGEAEALLRGARETAQTDGALPTLLSVHVALADVLRGQGRTDDARVEVAAAREIANQLAATIPAGELRDGYRRAVALLMGETAKAEAETTAPASRLTAREREVAAYVAAGRSNREIAGLLFVSERTVEAHVANILRKLGVPSRSGIAAWVTRQGITPPAT